MPQIIGLIVLLLVVYLITRQLKTKSIGEKLDKDINNNQLSYQLSQYELFADQIQEATDTTGTDESAIYAVFQQMNNNSDVLQLTKAYGSRFNYSFTNFGTYTLPQILTAECSTSEIAQINSILADKNITITF